MSTQKQNTTKARPATDWLFPLAISIVFIALASYTFNPKPDLNGDNYNYYMMATSAAQGNGFADLSRLGAPPTATFPPGYPALMTPLRLITDSITAQKWMNEIFVLASLLLLYFTLLRLKLPASVAFVSALSGACIPRLLHFSTMMMSEASFLLSSVAVMYFLLRQTEDERYWNSELKHPWLYLMIACLVLNYHIRTQGIALAAGVGLCLLVRRRWAALGTTAAGFIIGYLPWSLRNKALGLGGNRYLATITMANPWRPEEGALTIPEVIERFLDTLKMLVFQAIPSSIIPFAEADPDQPVYTVGLYILGGIMLVLIIAGFLKMGKLKWAMFGYFLATLGVISIFSTPSGSRYLTSIMPILACAEIVGLWYLLSLLIYKTHRPDSRIPLYVAYLFIPLLFTSGNGIVEEHQEAQQKYPVAYRQYFDIGKGFRKSSADNTVICCRKPQMMWFYAQRPCCTYKYTNDDKELIKDLVAKKVDYVILDALGYSSTGLYLYPAVQKNIDLFTAVMAYSDTGTYVLKFHRDKATENSGRAENAAAD